MPIYDLRCPTCGHEFDDLVPNRDAVRDVACEQCGTMGMERKPSLFASSASAASSSGSRYSSGAGCGTGGFT